MSRLRRWLHSSIGKIEKKLQKLREADSTFKHQSFERFQAIMELLQLDEPIDLILLEQP